jgi:hypothetical protein
MALVRVANNSGLPSFKKPLFAQLATPNQDGSALPNYSQRTLSLLLEIERVNPSIKQQRIRFSEL